MYAWCSGLGPRFGGVVGKVLGILEVSHDEHAISVVTCKKDEYYDQYSIQRIDQ